MEKYVVARETREGAKNLLSACPISGARMKICCHNI
jgi:hypothetical protein